MDKGKLALIYAGNALKAVGNMLGLTGLGIQKAGNRSAGKGLLSKAGEFVLGMFSAGAKAPFPINLVLPFVLGAVAGGIAAAMIGKYMKGDDVFSRGTGGGGSYGQRALFDKGAIIALNDSDNVIATTNPIKPVTKANDMYSQGTVTVANSTAPKPEPTPAPTSDNSGVERLLGKILTNTVTLSRA